MMIDNLDFAAAAQAYAGRHIPYSELDCQAFVEKVLSNCGVTHDWKGSNDMWRNALKWKGTVAECEERYGVVPPGALLFTIKYDGGEIPRGYTDGVNAAHVGIYTGYGDGAMHSTTGGVQTAKFPDGKRWTHVGLHKDVQYPAPLGSKEKVLALLEELKGAIECL